MSGSVRKRKSMWDSVEGTQLSSKNSEDSDWHGRGSYSSLDRSHGPKWSDSEVNDGLKSKDHSERLWDSSHENYGQKDDNISRDLNEISVTTRSWDGDKSYHISPGYNGRGRLNHSRSPENSLSQSRRYRSRSRDRGQRKSRSRSRGRDRDRDRDRDDRNWSRSQSRSPLRDHRRESYGGIERKSGSGISSHPCKDFTVGKCRRGSLCRFLHQDNLNQMDGGRSEKDRSERWRSRQEHGEPKDYHPPDKISDGYGNYDRRGGNSLFDHDRNRHPRRGGNSNPPCKFFAMGKCNRDNCRFSHDGPVPGNRERSSGDDRDMHNMADKSRFSHDGLVPGNRERSLGDDRDGYNMAEKGRFSHDGLVPGNRERSSADKSKLWNGPKWGDDAHGVSDVGDSNYGNKDYSDPRAANKQTDDLWSPTLDDRNNSLDGPKLTDEAGVSDARKTTEWGHPMIQRTAEKQTDDRRGKFFDDMNQSWDGPKLVDETGISDARKTTEWGHNLDNQSRMLSSPVPRDKASERDGYMSTHWRNDDNGVNMAPPESTGGAKSFRGEDSLLVRQDSDSQTFDSIYSHVSKQTATQEASGQQLATTVVNPGVSENYNIQPYDYKREQNVTIADDSNALSGVNISENVTNQNGDNMGFQTPSLVENDPSGLIIPRSPQSRPIQMFPHLNLENQNEIHHRESFKPFEMLQSQVPRINSGIPQNVVTSDPLVQMPNLSASLTQIFGSGQELPQLYATLNPPNSIGMVPSLPNSASFAPPKDGQPDPATRVLEQKDPFDDSMEPKKLGNETHEQNIPAPLKPIPNSEVKESNKITAEKWKQEKENDNPESVNEDGKVEEGYTGKDDKEMRLFKIALVEFVKEILKPTWKEGQMSREVHKAIVKKAVDKVTSTIQGIHIPKTQEKIDQYLSYSKPKITKLVQAYVERLSKN